MIGPDCIFPPLLLLCCITLADLYAATNHLHRGIALLISIGIWAAIYGGYIGIATWWEERQKRRRG